MVRSALIWSLLLFLFCPVLSQVPPPTMRSNSNLRKQADFYFERQAYSHAVQAYTRLAIGHPEDTDLQLLLGDCYRLLRQPANAAFWYGQVLENHTTFPTKHLFHYATTLCATGNYPQAKHWYQRYLINNPADQRAVNALESLTDPLDLFDSRFEVAPLPIDHPGEVFGPALLGNGLVFIGEGNTGGMLKKVAAWQERPYFDLYFVPLDNDGRPGTPRYLDHRLNSLFHEGPVVFFDNGNKVILTRSNSMRGENDTRNLRLMIASRKPNGSWGRPGKLFYHPDYSIGHPAINNQGTIIYFASNKPGGFGGTDLYKSEFIDGKWQQPVNLGPDINTMGNELFPSIDQHGFLYFSSDGHGGLGGLEIMQFELDGQNKPINMGHPINSQGDDFGIVWLPDENKGYFSTNRSGRDKIYYFEKRSQLVNAALPDN